MRRGGLLLIVLLSCGPDLAVPAAKLAPALASIDPVQTFSGETVTLHGTNLGAPADARVFIGGVTASVQLTSLADGALAVTVPAGLVKGKLDISISTSQGQSTLKGGFSWLGLG